MCDNYLNLSIKVNDIFDELSNENKRLLNELIFANKCLNTLKQTINKFQDFNDFVFNGHKSDFNQNILNRLQQLNEETEDVFNQIDFKSFKTENQKPRSDSADNCGNGSFKTSKVEEPVMEPKFEPNIYPEPIDPELNRNDDGLELGSNEKIKLKTQKPESNSADNCGNGSFETSKLVEPVLEQTFQHKVEPNICPKPVKLADKTPNRIVNGFKFESIKKIKLKTDLPKDHKSDELLKCSDCEMSFRSRKTLNQHIRLVHKKEVFTHICDYMGCDFKANRSHLMVKHRNVIHKNIRPFECSECDSNFGCKVSLNKHKKLHLLPQIKCQYPGCNKTFKRLKSSKDHYQKIHLNIRPEKTMHCEEPGCQFSCETKHSLLSHKYSHITDKPSVCTVDGCGKRFKNKHQLRTHMRSHITDFRQPFKCTECDFTYTHPGSLGPHRLRAHSNRVLHCEWPGCEYTTKITACLTRHQLVHTVSDDFACDWPECHKKFKSKHYLQNHLRIHNNDKRFVCQWPGCDYRCVSSSNIYKHKKIHEK